MGGYFIASTISLAERWWEHVRRQKTSHKDTQQTVCIRDNNSWIYNVELPKVRRWNPRDVGTSDHNTGNSHVCRNKRNDRRTVYNGEHLRHRHAIVRQICQVHNRRTVRWRLGRHNSIHESATVAIVRTDFVRVSIKNTGIPHDRNLVVVSERGCAAC